MNSSGISKMRLERNEQLLLSILDACELMEIAQGKLNTYYQLKEEEMNKETGIEWKGQTIFLYDFFVSEYNVRLVKRLKTNRSDLKEIASILDKKL